MSIVSGGQWPTIRPVPKTSSGSDLVRLEASIAAFGHLAWAAPRLCCGQRIEHRSLGCRRILLNAVSPRSGQSNEALSARDTAQTSARWKLRRPLVGLRRSFVRQILSPGEGKHALVQGIFIPSGGASPHRDLRQRRQRAGPENRFPLIARTSQFLGRTVTVTAPSSLV